MGGKDGCIGGCMDGYLGSFDGWTVGEVAIYIDGCFDGLLDCLISGCVVGRNAGCSDGFLEGLSNGTRVGYINIRGGNEGCTNGLILAWKVGCVDGCVDDHLLEIKFGILMD